jgi:hypothetical protein
MALRGLWGYPAGDGRAFAFARGTGARRVAP